MDMTPDKFRKRELEPWLFSFATICFERKNSIFPVSTFFFLSLQKGRIWQCKIILRRWSSGIPLLEEKLEKLAKMEFGYVFLFVNPNCIWSTRCGLAGLASAKIPLGVKLPSHRRDRAIVHMICCYFSSNSCLFV